MLVTLVWNGGDLYDLRSIELRSIVRREAHQIQCNVEATDEAWESLSDSDDSDCLSACQSKAEGAHGLPRFTESLSTMFAMVTTQTMPLTM